MFEHRREQVIEGCVLGECHQSTCWNISSALAGQNDRQVVVVMSIPIGDTSAVNDERIIEQRCSIRISRRAEFVQKVRELLRVIRVDLGDFLDFRILVLGVRQLMVPILHLDHREGSIATFVR